MLFRSDQPAASLWFHPHFYPTTAAQVIKGLAGLLIIDDDDTDRLALPSRWGVDDIPLIIQDRRFRHGGQFFDRMNIIAVASGYVGNVPLVNGARYPEVRTARGWVRLRLLDGSNARSYLLKASDDRSLFVIGSAGSLLETMDRSSDPTGLVAPTLNPGQLSKDLEGRGLSGRLHHPARSSMANASGTTHRRSTSKTDCSRLFGIRPHLPFAAPKN